MLGVAYKIGCSRGACRHAGLPGFFSTWMPCWWPGVATLGPPPAPCQKWLGTIACCGHKMPWSHVSINRPVSNLSSQPGCRRRRLTAQRAGPSSERADRVKLATPPQGSFSTIASFHFGGDRFRKRGGGKRSRWSHLSTTLQQVSHTHPRIPVTASTYDQFVPVLPLDPSPPLWNDCNPQEG